MIRPLAAALTALALAAPAQALDLTDMTEDERSAFRAEVRAYLLDNPEVLMEAIGVLEERQAEAQAQNDVALVQVNSDALFRDPASWVGGNPEGDVTLVEFVDYRCSYCRKAHEDVAQLVESDGNIRFIVKEFPILGEQSVISSQFAVATLQVAGPEAYKQVHDALITFRGTVTPENLQRLAESFDLDADAILAQMDAPEVKQVITENRALAQRMQISGTPTFVLEDQMLRGYVPLEGMRQIVAQVRAD
ncbi:DsbA family protein [Rhodovulum adriaticum]|uniref:Protein-disulfide isomerase n=1 Tax=Rhodovulum adriaticum TaxID=35804 RepID=A0A4R2NVU4_RHOAD|nr:DsbA family protein [Rhodovulum adriaticum]MBK1636461.1 disulfide bond formation protein DsbA [Rhodovulum adriaticum]TCP25535.1 protein-disulfide isomerase [Rhodovulum adriaticum]